MVSWLCQANYKKRRMSYLISVDVVQSIEQHLHNFLDLSQGELHISVAEQTGQVMLTEVKHQVDAALVSVELCGYSKGEQSKISPTSNHSGIVREDGTQEQTAGEHVKCFTFCPADFNQVHHILVFKEL